MRGPASCSPVCIPTAGASACAPTSRTRRCWACCGRWISWHLSAPWSGVTGCRASASPTRPTLLPSWTSSGRLPSTPSWSATAATTLPRRMPWACPAFWSASATRPCRRASWGPRRWSTGWPTYRRRWRACAEPSADLDDGLDLDRDVARQAAHADRRAGVAPPVPEHLDEQVRAAVDHLGLLAESGHGVDHAQQLDDPADPIEVAQLGFHGRDQLEAGHAGVAVGLLDRDILPDDAGVHGATRQIGAPAGEEEQVAGENRADIVRHRRLRSWQDDAELGQTLFDEHCLLPRFQAAAISPTAQRRSVPPSIRLVTAAASRSPMAAPNLNIWPEQPVA